MIQGNPPRRAQLKRFAHGKFYLYADAAEDHREIVEQALAKAAKVRVVFNDDAFCTALRSAGIPETTVQQYLESVNLIEDVFFSDRNTW